MPLTLRPATEDELQGLLGLDDFSDKTKPMTDLIFLDDSEAQIYIGGNGVAIATDEGLWEKVLKQVVGGYTTHEVLWWLCDELAHAFNNGSYRSQMLEDEGWEFTAHG